MTHAIDVHTIWIPTYRLESLAKLGTGSISILTAIVFFRLIPEALNIPTPHAFRKIKDKANQSEIAIFLDINMPIMNGWEFLEAYKKFEFPKFKELVIIMLTTSINPDDEEVASTYTTVNGFIRKPLKREKLNYVIEKHFKQLT